MIRGSYRLVRRLGSGGSGEVWVGRHVKTDGVAAVKVLRQRRAMTQRRLFAREGRAIAQLSHPHIVRLFEVGPEHIATALVDGSDLQRRLRGGIDAAAALRVTAQIGSALAYAHARGIVHRDVKPGNILVDRQGNAFLADFGLAHFTDDPDEAIAGGTPSFMAPEQARGRSAGPAADQYSLARTVVDMLIGGAPSLTADDALAQLPRAVAPLRDILHVATRDEPTQRWPSVDALLQRLASVPLPEVEAAVRLAPERRPVAPLLWSGAPSRVAQVGPAIARADYRLSEIEAAFAMPAEGARKFRESTGYAELGWSIYGRTDRLGPLGPFALARAGEIVVLLHGWLCTRELWHDMAMALVRDQPDALVLVPDLAGCGESRFGEVTDEQLQPRALGAMVMRWLGLLGLRELPGVLCGHSMAGLAILTIDPALLGDRLARVTLTPALMELVPLQRAIGLSAARLVELSVRLPRLRRAIDALVGNPLTAPGLGHDIRHTMKREFARATPHVVATLARAVCNLRMGPRALEGVEVVLGERDPTLPRRVDAAMLARFGCSPDRFHMMASGGHLPHLSDVNHPEWTARNQDELVRIIASVLLSCAQGKVGGSAPTTSDPTEVLRR
jgi:pimeloyl-ACP methyl ester carboxylesterase